MKAEDFLGVVVTVAATFVLIFGHCETIIWKYELLSWATGLLFILLYNLEIFRPKSKKFNFIVSYIGLSIAVYLWQYILYNFEIFRPKSKKFNFIVSYIGLSIAVYLGQYMMTDHSAIIVAVLLGTPIILSLLAAYVPKIAHQFAYRTPNHPVFPCKTFVLFSWAIVQMAILF